MLMFFLGLAIFFGLHTLPFLPDKRALIIKKLGGEEVYKVIFVAGSLIGLMLAGLGKGRFPFIELWPAPSFLRWLSLPVVYAAAVLVVAAYLPNNIPRYLRTPHPMLTGILVWAAMHMLANADLGSLVLFGSFLAYSLWAIRQSNLRAEKPEPLPALPLWRDGVVLGFAAIAFLILWGVHNAFFGRPVLLP